MSCKFCTEGKCDLFDEDEYSQRSDDSPMDEEYGCDSDANCLVEDDEYPGNSCSSYESLDDEEDDDEANNQQG